MAYVVTKAGLYYAVIYEGVNPVTGKERRRWHRCSDSADAQALACRLSAQRARARKSGSSMTLADYLLGRWLPAREVALSPTTYARYVISVEHYLLPHLGHVQLRQVHAEQLTSLYRRLAVDGGRSREPLAAKTILNLHQLVRAALDSAVTTGLLPDNPPLPCDRPILANGPRRGVGRRRGRPASWPPSSTRQRPTATGCCTGSRRPRGCDEASCWGCAGRTSTSTRGGWR